MTKKPYSPNHSPNTLRIGLGMAALGRPQYINVSPKEECLKNTSKSNYYRNAEEVLNYAHSQGIHYFDTAPGYGSAEEFLSQWSTKVTSKDLTFATKWGYTYTGNWERDPKVHEVKEHSFKKLQEQWSVSHKLLPQLQVYQIHSVTPESPVLSDSEVLDFLYHLKQKHNLTLGITTSGPSQRDTLHQASEISLGGISLFDAFQTTFNILETSCLETLRRLESMGKKVIIKESLANGRLFPNKKISKHQPLYQHLQQLADKYRVGVDAIAIRFCLQTFPSGLILSGASNVKQLEANLLAHSCNLHPDEMDSLQQFSIPSLEYWNERKNLDWN